MADITASFGSRLRKPGIGNPEESLDVLNHLRPGPAAEPEMPAPGTQLGPGVTHIGSLAPGEDAFYGDSAASQVKRARYFNDADQDMAVSNLLRLTGVQRGIRRDDQAEEDFDLENNAPRRANLMADVQDIQSERGAGRAFLPNAGQLYTRGRNDTRQDNYMRYTQPAQLDYDAKLGASELHRQGQIESAQIRGDAQRANAGNGMQEAVIRGLLNAMGEQINANKQINPKELDQMVGYLRRLTGGAQ